MRAVAAAALVAALVVPGLISPSPTQATSGVGVGIAVDPPVVLEGQTTTIHGRADGLSEGDPVVLKRHRDDGTYSVVARTRLDAGLRYRFTVTPLRRGNRLYLVVAHTPDGEARARTTAPLLVGWRPTVSASSRWATGADGERMLRVTGSTSYRGTQPAHLQVRSVGSWWDRDYARVDEQGRFRFDSRGAPGSRVRVMIPSYGTRLAAAATTVIPPLAPFDFELNHAQGTGNDWLSSYADNLIELPAGGLVTLAGISEDGIAQVLGPHGGNIPVARHLGQLRLRPKVAGRYVIRRVPGDGEALVASTPREYAGQLDVPLALAHDVPGRLADVYFTGVADQVVMTPTTWGFELFAPDGGLIDPLLSLPGSGHLFRLPATGTYLYRSYPEDPDVFDLRSVASTRVEPGQAPTTLELTARTLVEVAMPAATPVTIQSPSCAGQSEGVLFDEQGQQVPWFLDAVSPADATYLLYVTPQAEIPLPLTFVRSHRFDLGIDSGPVTLTANGVLCPVFYGNVDGVAGQVVRFERDDAATGNVRLTGPGGMLVPVGTDRYYLPATGSYTLSFTGFASAPLGDWSTDVSLVTATAPSLPTDGTPIEIPTGTGLFGRVVLPVGTNVKFDLDDPGVGSPKARLTSASAQQSIPMSGMYPTTTLTITDPGGVFVQASRLWSSSPGVATLRITVQ